MLTIKKHTAICNDIIDDFDMEIVLLLTVDTENNLQLSSCSSSRNCKKNVKAMAYWLLDRISNAIQPITPIDIYGKSGNSVKH